MTIYDLINGISSGEFDHQLKAMYGSSERNIMKNRARYLSAAENFSRLYPESVEIKVFSAGGAVEIGGGFTKRHGGRVLAAAVDADVIAIAAHNGMNKINFASDNSESFTIDLDTKSAQGMEASVIKAVLTAASENGIDCKGFDVYVSSAIPNDNVISMTAPLEVLISAVICGLSGDKEIVPLEVAELGRKADVILTEKNNLTESHEVCALGGFVLAENCCASASDYRKISFDFAGTGYSLCITSVGSSVKYDELDDGMDHVAREINVSVLGEADEVEFFENISSLREKCSTHELLNAVCFFDEINCIAEQSEALENGDTESFFKLINQSEDSLSRVLVGYSDSSKYEFPLAVLMGRKILAGSGAIRSGSGIVTAFVPNYLAETYFSEMSRVYGNKSCSMFDIRFEGICELKKVT